VKEAEVSLNDSPNIAYSEIRIFALSYILQVIRS